MTFEEAKQQAIEWSEWVLCHGAGYYTARTPDGRDPPGDGGRREGAVKYLRARNYTHFKLSKKMRTETITIYSYSELSEEAKATAYKAWEPDYAFEADNRRTLEAFCTAFGIEVTEYVYNSYCHSFRWRAKNEGDEEITDNEYIRHCLSLFEPTGFYLDEVILGPAKQPTEGKVFGNVIEECLEAFFSACCEDVKYTQSQEYFADFAENNEFEFYENGICIRHR